jgi:hypothetical protein
VVGFVEQVEGREGLINHVEQVEQVEGLEKDKLKEAFMKPPQEGGRSGKTDLFSHEDKAPNLEEILKVDEWEAKPILLLKILFPALRFDR